MSAADHEAAIREALHLLSEHPAIEASAAHEAWLNGGAALDALVGLLQQAEQRAAEARDEGFDEGRAEVLDEVVCSVCGENHDHDESAPCRGCVPTRRGDLFTMMGKYAPVLDRLYEAEARAERAEQERDEAKRYTLEWMESSRVRYDRAEAEHARTVMLEEALRDCVQGGYMDVIGYADCSGCKAAHEAAGEWWEHESIVAATHESDCPYYVYQRARAVLAPAAAPAAAPPSEETE